MVKRSARLAILLTVFCALAPLALTKDTVNADGWVTDETATTGSCANPWGWGAGEVHYCYYIGGGWYSANIPSNDSYTVGGAFGTSGNTVTFNHLRRDYGCSTIYFMALRPFVWVGDGSTTWYQSNTASNASFLVTRNAVSIEGGALDAGAVNTSTARRLFNIAKQNGAYSSNTDFDDTSAFCYNPDWEDTHTTFSASTTVGRHTVDNGTGIGDGSVTVYFTNTIRRTDNENVTSRSYFYRQYAYRIKRSGSNSWSPSENPAKTSDKKHVDLAKNGSTSPEVHYTVTGLHPGDTVQVCERISSYDSKVDVSSSGSYTSKETSSTAWNWNASPIVACKQVTMPSYTLKVEGRRADVDDNNLNGKADIDPAATGYGWKSRTRVNLYDNGRPTTYQYRFICWKDSTSSGTNGCITNTTGTTEYVSGSNNVTYNRNLTGNHTVYAYYARVFKLSISSDSHSSVKVERTSSPYSTTGELSDGAEIYKGDVLKVTFSADGCQSNNYDYIVDTHTVGGSSFTSGGTYTVAGDTAVVVTSKDQSKILTVHYRDISSSSSSIHADSTVRACKNASAETTRISPISGYKFVGWKRASWNGYADTYCTNSLCTNSTLSNRAIRYTDITNTTYAFDKYKRDTMDRDYEVYAVYAKKHALNLDAGAYTKIKVTRTASPYAKASNASKSAGSTSSSSGENDTGVIYDGDVLTVEFLPNSCFNWTKHTVDGVSRSTPYIISSNVGDKTIVTRAAVRQYTLTRSEATGSHAYVYRTDSKYGGGSTSSSSSLANNAALYCGDTIRATFSLNSGYSWGNYGWENNTHEWGYHFKSSNDGGNGDSWNVTGPKSGNSNDPTNHTSPRYVPGSTTTYTVDDNVTAETQAVLDKFKGFARADIGTSTNTNSTTLEKTGWVNTGTLANGTATIATKTIECANEGCEGVIDLYGRTMQGTGSMRYRIGTSKNWVSNNAISWVPSTSLNPSSIILPVTEDQSTHRILRDVLQGSTKLLPGQNTCRYLKFTPNGTDASPNVDVGACIETIVSTFEGKSSLSGGVSGAVGFTNTTGSKTYYINNCDNGCSASFTHELKRTKGIGSTDYTVSRTSNLTSTTRKIDNDSSVASGTFRPSTDTSKNNVATKVGTDPSSGSFTLYPGMKVCETLTFKPNNNTVTTASNVSTTVCALALGNAQPDDPTDPNTPNDPDNPSSDPNGNTGSKAFIDIEVKRTGTKYGTYRRIVYAKPNDTLTYRAYYNPTLQYTYYLVPQKMQINSGILYPLIGANSSSKLGTLYNLYKGSSLSTWTNSFSVQKKINSNNNFNSATLIANYTNYSVGSMTSRTEPNSVSVTSGNAGQSIDEQAITNLNSSTQTTPGQVKFSCSATGSNSTCTGNNTANVLTAAKSNIAYARIPYNFKTSVEITTPENTPIYAGEETQIDAKITIQPKPNSKTMDSGDKDYATKVGNPKYKIIVYQGNQHGGGDYASDDLCRVVYGLSENGTNCGYSAEVNGDDAKNNINGSDENNPSIKLYEDTVRNVNRTFYAQDLNAGSKICVSIAFWPATSGADINYNNPNGDNTWRVSPSKCYNVAKRPSLQIWGGNIYSTGQLHAATSVKNNVTGYTNYNKNSVSTPNSNNYVFGSWGELGVISVGKVSGLASAATTGYSQNGNGVLWPSFNSNNNMNSLYGVNPPGPGGSLEAKSNTNICLRSLLTFASCNGGGPGDLGGSMLSTNGSRDKQAIVKSFMKEKSGVNHQVSGTVTLNDTSKINDFGVYYYKSTGNLAIPGSIIAYDVNTDQGTTQIVHTTGNITITGNITYGTPASGSYQLLRQIPKLVVYSDKNIYIKCDVTHIDAMLIAEGTVVTCGETTNATQIKNNINNPENSNQLTINGTIIANKLIANRTYGAATGANSIIPAEIINYDATLYMWGANQADASGSGKLTVTQIEELAPRY